MKSLNLFVHNTQCPIYLPITKVQLVIVTLLTHNMYCIGCRRGCSFSHDLHSPHNRRMLTEHGLEGLSRAELSTLLLQSDNKILPSVSMDCRPLNPSLSAR